MTSVDKWDLPTQIIWACDAFWYTPDTLGHTYIEIGNVPTGESPWSWENFAVTGYGGMAPPGLNGHGHMGHGSWAMGHGHKGSPKDLSWG